LVTKFSGEAAMAASLCFFHETIHPYMLTPGRLQQEQAGNDNDDNDYAILV